MGGQYAENGPGYFVPILLMHHAMNQTKDIPYHNAYKIKSRLRGKLRHNRPAQAKHRVQHRLSHEYAKFVIGEGRPHFSQDSMNTSFSQTGGCGASELGVTLGPRQADQNQTVVFLTTRPLGNVGCSHWEFHIACIA